MKPGPTRLKALAGRNPFLLAGCLSVLVSALLHPLVAVVGILLLAAHVAASSPAATRTALWTAWAARTAVAALGLTFATLPDSTLDAVMFQAQAADWAHSPLASWGRAMPYNSDLYPWLLAGLYRWTGASLAVGIALNVLLGTLVVRAVAAGAETLWGGRARVLAAWMAALFPTLVLYSSVLLRESLLYLLLAGAAWGVLRTWGDGRHRPAHTVGAVSAWALAALLLPPLQEGFRLIVPFLVFAAVAGRTDLLQGRRGAWIVAGAAIAWIAYRFLVVAYFPWLDVFGSAGIESIEEAQDARRSGRTAYPDWLTITRPLQGLLLAVPRILAFLFLPLGSHVQVPIDIAGALDALLYLCLAVLCVRALRSMADPRVAFLFALAGLVILVYAMGVSNVGTAVRHRAKAALLLLVLAAGPLDAWLHRVRPTSRSQRVGTKKTMDENVEAGNTTHPPGTPTDQGPPPDAPRWQSDARYLLLLQGLAAVIGAGGTLLGRSLQDKIHARYSEDLIWSTWNALYAELA